MSKNIVFEGWLTKSPPIKRIWRTKWRRRWFALRQGELPGQYFLDYYADRNCRRLKGTINLDLCEQVDAGLHLERSGHGIDPKLRGSVFTIQTQSRIYHLEADCEAEMQKWVDALCRVCNLRATDEVPVSGDQNNRTTTLPTPEGNQYTGPYIPISECITGIRAQGSKRFTFDAQNIKELTSNKFDQARVSQPHVGTHPITDLSENESNISEDECKSLNTSQPNVHTPPIPPPRPPKTFLSPYQGPKILEPIESQDTLKVHEPIAIICMSRQSSPRQRTLQRQRNVTSTSPIRQQPTVALHHDPVASTSRPQTTSYNRQGHVAAAIALGSRPQPVTYYPGSRQQVASDDEDDIYTHAYINLGLPLEGMPPIVDRALKPRNYSMSHLHHLTGETIAEINRREEQKSETLQYLDLDLKPSQPSTSKVQNRKVIFTPDHKSLSDIETGSVYKTVDFLKTEAFNSTRQESEAFRSQPVNALSN